MIPAPCSPEWYAANWKTPGRFERVFGAGVNAVVSAIEFVATRGVSAVATLVRLIPAGLLIAIVALLVTASAAPVAHADQTVTACTSDADCAALDYTHGIIPTVDQTGDCPAGWAVYDTERPWVGNQGLKCVPDTGLRYT